MPYNSGVYAFVIILAASLIWAIWETMRDEIHPVRMKISFILSIVLLGIPFIGSGYVIAVILTAALTAYLFMNKRVYLQDIEYDLGLYDGNRSGLFILCLDIDPCDSRYAYEPERSARYLYLAYSIWPVSNMVRLPLIYGQTYVSEVKRENQGGTCIPVLKEGEPTWSRIIKNR